MIGSILCDERGKRILNVCSSDEKFWLNDQPYIFQDVLQPLLARGNLIDHLDMKTGRGINIVADCTDMKTVAALSYDIVLFTSGVEHLLEPLKALQEIHRVLKDDGFMVCSAPGVYPFHPDPIDTMLRLPDLESWKELLAGAWVIEGFWATTPIPAKPFYHFSDLVFASVVSARKRMKGSDSEGHAKG